MNSFEISESFVRYYENAGFERLPSASPLDPSVPIMFVMSAGLTLSRGYRQLDRLLANNNGCSLGGSELVSLVKQFGFPASLLKATLARKGVEFKESEYLRAIEQWQANLHTSRVNSH